MSCRCRPLPVQSRRSEVVSHMNPMPGREVLPIPDRDHKGLVTFDAKDPDTSFPPIERVTPPEGAETRPWPLATAADR